jgi:hypothetical protein
MGKIKIILKQRKLFFFVLKRSAVKIITQKRKAAIAK